MTERIQFLIVYIGSAAMAAFLAVCLSSPRIDAFTCSDGGPSGDEPCRLADTMAEAIGTGEPAAVDAQAQPPAPARVAAAR